MGSDDRNKLETELRKDITKLFEAVLDYTAIAVSDESTFKVLRGKILRVGNDCIRKVSSELADYNIEYLGRDEDIIEVKRLN